MGLFSKKKKEEVIEVKKEPNLLEILCGDDKALYEDLSYSLLLEPRSKGTFAEAIEKARKADAKNALLAYATASGLALYEGNVDGVKEAFEKYGKLSAKLPGREYKRIREVPEKAIKIAQEYYKKELKPIKEKK